MPQGSKQHEILLLHVAASNIKTLCNQPSTAATQEQ
jgi:hypothetical protein